MELALENLPIRLSFCVMLGQALHIEGMWVLDSPPLPTFLEYDDASPLHCRERKMDGETLHEGVFLQHL